MKRSGFDHAVIDALSMFIRKLNDESMQGAIVVVEGPRDAEALNSLGYAGALFTLCHSKGLSALADEAERYKKAILLLDLDQKGRILTKKAARILQEKKVAIDLFYRKELAVTTRGRVRQVEELNRYREYLHSF